jgi:hypothetical protein
MGVRGCLPFTAVAVRDCACERRHRRGWMALLSRVCDSPEVAAYSERLHGGAAVGKGGLDSRHALLNPLRKAERVELRARGGRTWIRTVCGSDLCQRSYLS